MNRFFILLLTLLLSANAIAAEPSSKPGVDSLRRFFNEVNSFSARFTQVVLDENKNPIQESSGSLWIERPNKFRWNYDTPYKQQIVADGKRIWVYDVGLQQVTVRSLNGSLGDTPAMLLAGKGRLDDSFAIKALDSEDNIEWVRLLPRRKDSGYEDIRIGFDQGKLRILQMIDGFGHVTRITLSAAKENSSPDANLFSFTPPKDVDVVGE